MKTKNEKKEEILANIFAHRISLICGNITEKFKEEKKDYNEITLFGMIGGWFLNFVEIFNEDINNIDNARDCCIDILFKENFKDEKKEYRKFKNLAINLIIAFKDISKELYNKSITRAKDNEQWDFNQIFASEIMKSSIIGEEEDKYDAKIHLYISFTLTRTLEYAEIDLKELDKILNNEMF